MEFATDASDARFLCEECGWRGFAKEVLRAPNPFDKYGLMKLEGCPNCYRAQSLHTTCDEPGCWELDTCGTQTPIGYRRTCREHRPIGPGGEGE